MIITKTPFRMSFFGGGTDVQDFFMENPGAVISTTIDKYCFVNARHLPRFFDYTSEFAYSKIERVTNISEIQHPAIREAMKMLYMHEIRLSYDADLPGRSGLGTSSSFAVGMLNAFYSMKGQYVDKRRLADDAIYLERVLCKEAGGWQDQIAASFGGLNLIEFHGNSYEVYPVVMPSARKTLLDNNLMMFFTGFTRFSSDVQHANNHTPKEEKFARLRDMYQLVGEAHKILTDPQQDLDEFGRMLDYTWRLKRQTGSKVSTDEIDRLYNRGIEAGAIGGKLLGAGGGGFLLFYVPEDKRENLMRVMAEENRMYIPFQFEEGGTRVIYYSSESYSSNERRERD